MLNCWIISGPKYPHFALKHARRPIRHCLTPVSIARWSSQTTLRWCRHLITQWRQHRLWKFGYHFTQRYLQLSSENFVLVNRILTELCCWKLRSLLNTVNIVPKFDELGPQNGWELSSFLIDCHSHCQPVYTVSPNLSRAKFATCSQVNEI